MRYLAIRNRNELLGKMIEAPPKIRQLVIASRNLHKIREFRSILSPLKNVDLLSLLDFPHYTPPEETGSSFEENAQAKAIHAAYHLNTWALGDDSGLVVPALQGQPGLYSSRYAGEHATDVDNRKKLLLAMQHLLEEDRAAHYICSIALASAEGLKKCVTASCEGRLLPKEKGGGGFGYDSLFVKYDYSKTFAELEESIKNRISHRRKALDKIMIFLENLS